MTGERYTLQQHEEYRRQQDEKAEREAQERTERTEKASAYRAWIRGGGRPQDFERSWPEIKAEQLRRRVADHGQQALRAQRTTGISRI